MAIGSEMPPTAVLELFTIPVLTGNAGPTPMTRILSFGLPLVDDGCRVANIHFYHPPIENVLIRDNCLFSNTTGTDKPFISTSSDDIIFATLNIGVVTTMTTFRLSSTPQHSYVLFLPMSTCRIQFHGNHGVQL